MTDRDRLYVLVVEDNASDRMILVALLKQLGHEVVQAADGSAAIQHFIARTPDMVLLDVLMPGMDGRDTARRLRELAGQEWVPIVFLTALHEAADLAACLEAGGDDFLSKPYNPIVLKAKLAAYSRMRRLHSEVQRQREYLLQEQRMAKAIFNNIAQVGALNSPNIRHQISPLALFNGDVLLAAHQPNGDMLVFVGDFTGHGLPAAIGTLPLADIFHGMAAKGFALEDILREINAKLNQILPLGVFCCATALCLNARSRGLEVWAGGLPDGLIFNRHSGDLREITSRHLPLGILAPAVFKYTAQYFVLAPEDRVYLWTDGVVEGLNAAGELFGADRLRSCFATGDPEGVFDRILAETAAFSGSARPQDDRTLIEVALPKTEPGVEAEAQRLPLRATGPYHWCFEYELKAESLREFDPVPMLTHILMQVPGLRAQAAGINTILGELFANALEHGVLGLDSSLKQNAQGFNLYYQQRQARLQALDQGFIRLRAEHEPSSRGGVLRLMVQDSGAGFDFLSALSEGSRPGFYGRGMTLVSSLCQRVEYLGSGNQVLVEFAWQQE